MDRKFKCGECGKHFENLQSYSGCPDGHGKLFPWITDEDKGDYAEETLPAVSVESRRPKRYRIGEKIYRFASTITGARAYKRLLDPSLKGSDIMATGPWKRGFAILREVK